MPRTPVPLRALVPAAALAVALLAAAFVGAARAAGSCDVVIRPGSSINSTAEALQPGQTLCLAPGVYVEDVSIRRGGKRDLPVTIQSVPGERASVRGRLWVAESADWVTIQSLVLDGRNGRGLPSPSVHGDHVTFRDNDVTNHRSGAGGYAAGICFSLGHEQWGIARHTLIERNRIHDCGRRPPTENDHGIYVAAGVDGVIRDNVIHRNADRGIQLYPTAFRTTIDGNTVDGNGSGIIFSEQSSNNLVRANIFSNSIRRYNAESFELNGGGNRFVANCLVPGHPDDRYNENGGVRLPDIVEVTGNVGEANDPFRDRPRGDFRLRPGTRCEGKGAPEAVAAPR